MAMKTKRYNNPWKRKHSVYLVDDDPIFLEILEEEMKQLKYVNVRRFANGETCLNQLRKEEGTVDVIFLDYDLAGGKDGKADGVSILRKIKKSSPTTEVVMLTGSEDLEVAVEAMRFGAFDFIVKNDSAMLRARNALTWVNNRKLSQTMEKGYRKILHGVIGVLVLIIVGAIVYTMV